jgi:phage baseplate assembly protein gpV
MFESIGKLTRDIAELRRLLALLRKVLIRQGTIDSVDTTACTVVVAFPNVDVLGVPSKSHPMPWLQRSSEHRPPAVGDHALVLDPSLGAGAGLVIVGWPSTAKPSPGIATSSHVLYKGTETAKVDSPDVQLGVSPTDFAALAAKTNAEITRIWDVLTHASIVPAPAAAPDAGEPGLTTLKTLAAAAKIAAQSVAAAQVKIK